MGKHSFKVGFSFGMMSGIITTLGLMVGLHAGTESRSTVLGGIIIIAIADAFSDALGIHISEESENVHTPKEIWTATISTFFFKFFFSSIFIIPVMLFELTTAMLVSIAVGFLLIIGMSCYLARRQGISAWKVVLEHCVVALVVISATHAVGEWVAVRFTP